MTCISFCFRLQAWVCLIPSLRPSSTELMPFLAVTTSHMARNPGRQRQFGGVEDGAGGERGLVPAGPALDHGPGAEPRALARAAARADETHGPPELLHHRPALLLPTVRLPELC